jgi:hypothetical protein
VPLEQMLPRAIRPPDVRPERPQGNARKLPAQKASGSPVDA